MLQHDFAAIILDIRMPGMNGIELAHLVKQRRRTRDVPILFLTAHLVDDADVLRGYGVGAVDYLSKPLNADILRSKVAVFVELFRKTRQLAAINAALQSEVVERHRAQQALAQANQELELRVAERTAALTVAHRGVRENEERLRLAMDVAQMAAWEWDVDAGRMTWSTDPEALFGFPAGAFGPELRMTRAVHPEDKARVDAAESSALAKGLYECEYRVVRPSGAVVWVTERGQVLRRGDGTVEKIVGVSRDVSAQRRAEQEGERLLIREREARDEAERQSRFKDEFLATLSHELRTPINAILGWLSILSRGEAVRDPAKAIAVIQRNAQMQAKLIEDLLEMNKLTSGTARLDVALVDVKSTVENALQALQPTADAKGIRLIAAIDPAVPHMTADGRRLQQVIWNLVHNAIKFTPDQGRRRGRRDPHQHVGADTRHRQRPGDFVRLSPIRVRSLSPGRFLSDTRGVGARNRAVDCEAHRRAARGDHRGRERGPGRGLHLHRAPARKPAGDGRWRRGADAGRARRGRAGRHAAFSGGIGASPGLAVRRD